MRFTLDLIAAGHKKYSAQAIIERMRWHMTVEKGDRDFKLNDHWKPYLSRYFAELYPEHAGFFNYRRLRCNGGGDHEDYSFFD